MALTRINNQALPTLDSGKLPSGTVLQVKQTVVTTTQSSNSQSYEDALSVSITPTSTNSKILVMCDIALSTSNGHTTARLLRGSTVIYAGTSVGSREEAAVQLYSGSGTDHAYSIQRSTVTFLDSPATTSATTYKMQIGTPASTGYTIYMNRQATDSNNAFSGRTASSITVMEIAG